MQVKCFWAAPPLKAFLLLAAGSSLCQGQLKWESTRERIEFDWGTKSIESVFVFENTGDRPVKIIAVESSCGCTAVSDNHQAVLPGHKGRVSTLYTPGSRTGVHTSRIDVKTDNPALPVYRLDLEAHIPEWIQTRPRMLWWRSGSKAGTKEVTVTFHEKTPVKPAEIKVQPEGFEVQWVETNKNSVYILQAKPLDTSQRKQVEWLLPLYDKDDNPLEILLVLRIL